MAPAWTLCCWCSNTGPGLCFYLLRPSTGGETQVLFISSLNVRACWKNRSHVLPVGTESREMSHSVSSEALGACQKVGFGWWGVRGCAQPPPRGKYRFMGPGPAMLYREYGKTQRRRGRDNSPASNGVFSWDVVAQILFVLGKKGMEVYADAVYHLTSRVVQQN